MNEAFPNNFSSEQIQAANTVTAVTPDLSPVTNSRVNQQYIRPQAVKDRNIGPIVTSSHSGLGNADFVTATVPNSSSRNIYFTLTDKQGRVMLAVPDVSVYIGSVTDANQWPTSTVGGGNFPVYVMNDFGQSDNVNVVTHVVCRNNTGVDQTIVVACRWRIVVNPANTFEQAPTQT